MTAYMGVVRRRFDTGQVEFVVGHVSWIRRLWWRIRWRKAQPIGTYK